MVELNGSNTPASRLRFRLSTLRTLIDIRLGVPGAPSTPARAFGAGAAGALRPVLVPPAERHA